MHDAGLGRAEDFCRVAIAGSCPRVPAPGRATDADASGTSILFCSHSSPAPSETRTYAADLARAVTLCSAERVKLLVASAPQGP